MTSTTNIYQEKKSSIKKNVSTKKKNTQTITQEKKFNNPRTTTLMTNLNQGKNSEKKIIPKSEKEREKEKKKIYNEN